jgi:hypothetical protein
MNPAGMIAIDIESKIMVLARPVGGSRIVILRRPITQPKNIILDSIDTGRLSLTVLDEHL